jgi:hypothetical protein
VAEMKESRPDGRLPSGWVSARGAERYGEKCSTGRRAVEAACRRRVDRLAEIATATPSGGRRQGGGGEDQGESEKPGKLESLSFRLG